MDKKQRSTEEDEEMRQALGESDKCKLLESLYRKKAEEFDKLREESDMLKRRLNKESGDSSEQSSSLRRSMSTSASLTQLLLQEASTTQLKHPEEFFQVLEKENMERIQYLEKKTFHTNQVLERVQRERDELYNQIQKLRASMTEKDEQMKKLEQRSRVVPSAEEPCSCTERARILKTFEVSGPTSSSPWVMVDDKTSELTQDNMKLREKIDELQKRIKELLNHNDQWNKLCQDLQTELDQVKEELQKYRKGEVAMKDSLLADLKIEKEKREEAEHVSLRVGKHVEELEAKVAELEKQLADREKDKSEQLAMAREKTFLIEEQMKLYKEDYENEVKDHTKTKNELASLRTQWATIHKELIEKCEQIAKVNRYLEDREIENRTLKEQLQQAKTDVSLIRDHRANMTTIQSPGQRRESDPLEGTSGGSEGSEESRWPCAMCTYLNPEPAIVCHMCDTARSFSQRKDSSKSSKFDMSNIGQLEEDGSMRITVYYFTQQP